MTDLNLSICLPKYSLILYFLFPVPHKPSRVSVTVHKLPAVPAQCGSTYSKYSIMPKPEQVQTQLRRFLPQKTVPVYGLRVQTRKASHAYAPRRRCTSTKMMPIRVERNNLRPICGDACVKRPLLPLPKEVEIGSRQKLLLAREV